jgi:hypothetical protein
VLRLQFANSCSSGVAGQRLQVVEIGGDHQRPLLGSKRNHKSVDRVVEATLCAEDSGGSRQVGVRSHEPTTFQRLPQARLAASVSPDFRQHRREDNRDDSLTAGQFEDRPKSSVISIGRDESTAVENQRSEPNRRRARAISSSVISPCSFSKEDTASAIERSANFCSAASLSHDETDTPSSCAARSTAASTSSWRPTDRLVTVRMRSMLPRCYRREQRQR